MRKTLLGLFLICLVYFPKAQQKLPSLDYRPQSPVTAAFTRYGDIPVDLSTGVPAISVPVYTLSSHGINVPISLSYHASGIKVRDIASPVGLGWTLNAGGIIARSVFGQADEYLEMYRYGQPQTLRPPWKDENEFMQSYSAAETNQTALETWNSQLYEAYLNKSTYDFYSDRYYYSLGNGESGVFRRDFKNNDIKLIPYRPLKTRFYWTGSQVEDLKIDMTTTDGTVYTFKRNKFDLWHLEKITNGSGTESVAFYSHYEEVASFNYYETQDFGKYKMNQTPKTEAYVYVHPLYGVCVSTLELRESYVTSGVVENGSNVADEVVLIDSIVSSDAVVKFTYAQDRQDYQIPSLPNASPHARLTKVQVFSKPAGALIKEVNLSHTYKSDNIDDLTKRLMLDEVKIGANAEEKYVFTYNAENMPPYAIPKHDASNPVFQEDLWGYKNNGGGINLLMSEFAPFGSIDMYPDEQKAKACILEEIRYPTGGKTVFEFESNRVPANFYNYSSPKVPADGKVGGLRVKKISNYASEGVTPEVKQYEYDSYLNNSYGVLYPEKFVYTQLVFNSYDVPHCNGTGIGVFYAQTSSSNIAVSRPLSRYIGSAQAPVIYDEVTEYIGNTTTNLGKTVYHYETPSMPPNGYYNGDPRFAGPWPEDIGNYTPQLQSKKEYKNDNGQYKLVRKTENAFIYLQDNTFSTGFNLGSDLQFVHLNSANEVNAFYTYNFAMHNSYYSTLHYSNNYGYTRLALPGIVNVYDYVDNNNYLKTTTEYSYNQYGQQITANTTTSKGDVLTAKSTYPVDYANQAPYNTMVQKNILSPVIEQSTYKNANNFLQSTKTTYDYWDASSQTWGNSTSNQILPKYVETKKGVNTPEIRLRYFSYDDKGNPLFVAKENDTRQLYIWGYNKTHPVAHVLNVPESERPYLAYTSFEENNTGNWILSGSNNIIGSQTAPTGNLVFLLGNNELSRSILPTTTYILSYWYKDGHVVNVSGNSTLLISSAPKNGWIYVKRKITGASTVSITGFGQIDEVRLYPESAQMTTIAYDPLIGMTAQCDVNDKITYYTYDVSGRLTLVKDDDGHVLKKICYNFQGQPDACGENAVPLWQATGATRCKPCPQNSNYYTTVQQREEKDNNAYSETYGNTRWADLGVTGACVVQPGWQFIANTRCVVVNAQNTGEQEREQSDANPCSSGFGQTRWVSVGMNTTACPLPAVFHSQDISGNYYNQNCTAPQVPLPYYVSMPSGSYTSSINEQDATNKARQEAQRRANQSGGCTTVYVRLVAEVLPPEVYDNLTYEYTNWHFKFYSDAAGTIPLTLPVNLAINFQGYVYTTDDGGAPYDYGSSNQNVNGYTGYDEAVIPNDQTLYCEGTHCYHWGFILKSGPYVIIP
jgi:hypothetical protein